VSELLSHSPKIIEFYLSIQILFKFYSFHGHGIFEVVYLCLRDKVTTEH